MSVDRSSSGSVSELAAAVAAADLAAEAVAEQVKLLLIAADKASAGEVAGTAACIAHQVHGAVGFTFEHSLPCLTRRLWSWRDAFGKDAMWNRLLGRRMAQAGADRLWAESVTA